MLRLAASWVWDFWFADDGDRYHLYFLYASRALRDPDARHIPVVERVTDEVMAMGTDPSVAREREAGLQHERGHLGEVVGEVPKLRELDHMDLDRVAEAGMVVHLKQLVDGVQSVAVKL